MKNLLRLTALFFLATGALPIPATAKEKPSAAAHTADGEAAGMVPVPEGLKASDVQRSILEAATNRGWAIKSRDDGKVTIFLENGRWIAALALVYDENEVRIYSKSTRNGKPSLPEDWIKYIKQDLTKSLNTKAYLK